MKSKIRAVFTVNRPQLTGGVSLGHGVNEFFSIVIPPVIPLLVADFGITYAQAGLLLTVFFAMYSIFQLPAGILADTIGKFRLVVLGLGGMSFGIFLASIAPTFEFLLIAQGISGIFGSSMHPAGMAMISDAETAMTEGKAMGVWGAGGKVGTMGAPLLVGGIASFGGWRLSLVGAAIGGLVVTVILIPFLRTDDSNALLATAMPAAPEPAAFELDAIIHSIHENVRVPLTKPIVLLFFIAILISIQSRAIQTFTTAFMVEGTAVSVLVGNIAFFALLMGGAVGQVISGGLADTFNRGSLGAIAAMLTAILVAGTIGITAMSQLISPMALVFVSVGWLFLIGGFIYSVGPVKNALVSNNAESGYSGGLFGVIHTGSAIGSATGPVLIGVIATEFGLLVAYPVVALVSLVLAGLFLLLWWESSGTPE